MIKTHNLVPSVYYDQSRDFQFLGRVLEVLFNYSKMNTDLMENFQKNDSLVDLLCTTVGFEPKHEYVTSDLLSVCQSFIDLVRNKGNKQSIENAIHILMNNQNVSGEVIIEDHFEDNTRKFVYYIYLPSELKDLVLLEDIFDYILPCGYDYRFIPSDRYSSDETKTNLGFATVQTTYEMPNAHMSLIAKPQERDSRPDSWNGTAPESGVATTFTTTIYNDLSDNEGE